MSLELKKVYKKMLKKAKIESEILNVKVTATNLNGGNFTSKCETVCIKFQDATCSPLELFVKTISGNSEYAKQLQIMQFFEKEATFFNEVLPDLKEFCKEKLGSDELLQNVTVSCLYADSDLVALENLGKIGYITLDKKYGHSMSHVRKVLDTLARLHGASYAFLQANGIEKFKEKYPLAVHSNIWSEQGRQVAGFWIQGIIKSATQILEKNPVPGSEKVLQYLRNFGSDPFSKLRKAFQLTARSCGLVLNHGDAWNANIMFRKNSETKTPENCTLIDFQTIYLDSPAADLQKYIFMSVKPDIRLESWRGLLEMYYTNFQKYVEAFSCKVMFSFEELLDDYRDKSDSGFIYCLYFYYGFAAVEEVGSVENIEGDVMQTILSVVSAVSDIFTDEKGIFLATQIVKEFEEFEKLKATANNIP